MREDGSRAVSISNICTSKSYNQKPIGSVTAYQAQCTLPPHPIYQTLLFDFRGSGSKITEQPTWTAEFYGCLAKQAKLSSQGQSTTVMHYGANDKCHIKMT